MYPAAYDNVIGVASTSNDDVRSTFSNYGASVWVAAPGEAVITTYPVGKLRRGLGHLLQHAPGSGGGGPARRPRRGRRPRAERRRRIANAQPLTPELGNGRLDLVQAVTHGRHIWVDAAQNPVPDSCSIGVDWTEE